MQRRYVSILRAVFLLSMALILTGCASRVPTETIRSSLSTGYVSDLREKMEKSHKSAKDFVTALNLARVLQIEGRWKESIQRYDEALQILEEYEARAQINIRAIGSTVGTFLLARGAKQYYGMGYERSLLHTFNALNYVMLEDFTGAAVEMRKMEKRQEFWLQESQSRIEQNMEKSQYNPMNLPPQYSMRDMLVDDSVRSLINNYQEPFSYALAAILLRIAGDTQAADVDMRRAIALDKTADALFRNAWPVPKVAAPVKVAETAPRNKKGRQARKDNAGKADAEKEKAAEQEAIVIPRLSPPVPAPSANAQVSGKDALPNAEQTAGQSVAPPETQEVTVIALGGMSPALKVEHVRIRFPGIGYFLLDLPSYTRPVAGATPSASLASGVPLVFYPLLRTDRLAYRTLQDEVGLEIGSAMSRAAVRAGISAAAYAAARSNKDSQDYAVAASVLTTMLLDLWTYSMSASARNWEMLPNEGYIAMATVPTGSAVTVGEGPNQRKVSLPNHIRGVIIVLTCFSNTNMRMDYVAY